MNKRPARKRGRRQAIGVAAIVRMLKPCAVKSVSVAPSEPVAAITASAWRCLTPSVIGLFPFGRYRACRFSNAFAIAVGPIKSEPAVKIVEA